MKKLGKQLDLLGPEWAKKPKARKKVTKSLLINEQGDIIGVMRDDCTESIEQSEKSLASEGIKMGEDALVRDQEELYDIAMEDIRKNGGQMTERARKILIFLNKI